MKKFFQPSSLLLYLLSILVFFLGVASLTSMAGLAKNQGLAGAAIVIGYGFIAAFIALIAAVMIVHLFNKELVILLVKILAVIFAILILYLKFRPRNEKAVVFPPISPPITTVAYHAALNNSDQQKFPPGIGMANPNFSDHQVIYFYNNPYRKNISAHPVDSLVIETAKHGPDISYAPPWFAPVHLKLDYGILLLHAISAGQNFIEARVNEFTGQTVFLDRTQCALQYWPEFLLNINSVTQINRQDNPVRIKPLSHASTVNGDYEFLRPINIRQQWMQVELLNSDFRKTGQGWIQWKKDGQLLITYSLLS